MIAAYKGVSGISRTIRLINWNDVSHVSWVEPNEWEIEAWVKGGVRKVAPPFADHTPATVVDLYAVALTDGERAGLHEFLHDQLGKEYDRWGVLHFVTRRPPYPGDRERWFCSELIFAAFVHIKKPLLLRVPAHKVYPGMIVYSPLLRHAETVTVPEWARPARNAPDGPRRAVSSEAGQDTPQAPRSILQTPADRFAVKSEHPPGGPR